MILNNEMIEYQYDDSFIRNACNIIAEIRLITKFGNNGIEKDGYNKIKELEELFSNRFNIDFIIGFNNIENCYCIPVGPSTVMNLDRYVDWYETEKKLNEKTLTDLKLTPKTLERMRNDGGISYWLKLADKGTLEFLNSAKNDGFEMDLKRARLITKPTDMRWYLNCDFKYFLWNKDGTPEEMLGVILHEVGHCWTYLEYSYRLFGYTQTLTDVMRTEYGKNGKTINETLTIYYKKTGLGKPPNKNGLSACIQVHKDILNGLSLTNNHNHGTDFERWADEFATRMGLGVDTQRILHKFEYSGFELNKTILVTKIIRSTTWLLMFIIATIMSSTFLILLGGVSFILTILDFIYVRSGSGLYGKYSMIYDERDIRTKKTRNSLIRELKYVEDKEIRNKILSDIEECDKMINEFASFKENTLFYKTFLKFAEGRALDEINLTELLEDLNANKLHVGYYKIKNILERK